MQTIQRDNVQDFVTFSLFCCTYEQLTPAQHQQSDDFIDRIERVWDLTCALPFSCSMITVAFCFDMSMDACRECAAPHGHVHGRTCIGVLTCAASSLWLADHCETSMCTSCQSYT